MHFGEHLMIDGYGGALELLNKKECVLAVLERLPKQLGMQVIGAPQIVYFPGNDIKDPGGWTGVTLIAESHISIHTFPKRGFLTADIYTCKNGMEKDVVIEYLKKTFALTDVEINFVKRGTRYPDNNIY